MYTPHLSSYRLKYSGSPSYSEIVRNFEKCSQRFFFGQKIHFLFSIKAANTTDYDSSFIRLFNIRNTSQSHAFPDPEAPSKQVTPPPFSNCILPEELFLMKSERANNPLPYNHPHDLKAFILSLMPSPQSAPRRY